MPRAEQNKLYRTFTKGLITEAGYLTYPEDASVDELNTVISRKGNRTRRVGVDFEQGYALEDVGLGDDKVINTHTWGSVNNKAELGFVAVQVGSRVYFYDLQAATAISASKKSFSISLLDYRIQSAPSSDISRTPCEFSSGSGFLFIAHKYVDPLVVEYVETTDSLNTVKIVIQTRDLLGLNDGLANDEEPGALSVEHFYNLRNQGWVSPGTRSTSTAGGSTYYDPYNGGSISYDPGGYSGNNLFDTVNQ